MLALLALARLGRPLYLPRSLLANRRAYPDVAVPANYSFLAEFPECATADPSIPVLRALGDRFCRFLGRPLPLSLPFVQRCDPTSDGASIRSRFLFLEDRGATARECHPLPFNRESAVAVDFCRQCAHGGALEQFRARRGSLRQLGTAEEIRKEIYIYGPVTGEIGAAEREIVGWETGPAGLAWVAVDEGRNTTVTVAHAGDEWLPESFVYAIDPDVD
jgi:hypothetical protein